MNFVEFLRRTPFLQNNSGRLLVQLEISLAQFVSQSDHKKIPDFNKTETQKMKNIEDN